MSMIGNFLAIPIDKANKLRADQSQVENFLYSDEVQASGMILDIDKAWHGVHYLLTGSDWEGEEPLRSVVLGGEEIGDDAGYGPARLLDSEKVKIINEALSKIEPSDLESRYDPKAFNDAEIYPTGWGEHDAEYILGAFREIKKFYANAAMENQCVLQFIN